MPLFGSVLLRVLSHTLQESNPRPRFWRPMCYHYTKGIWWVVEKVFLSTLPIQIAD